MSGASGAVANARLAGQGCATLGAVTEALRVRFGPLGVSVPSWLWPRAVAREARGAAHVLSSLTDEERRIRRWVVTELGALGSALDAVSIATALELEVELVRDALERLERKMVFLWRNEDGAVSWAYPVTVDTTPHQLAFKTGERMTAA